MIGRRRLLQMLAGTAAATFVGGLQLVARRRGPPMFGTVTGIGTMVDGDGNSHYFPHTTVIYYDRDIRLRQGADEIWR